ncbi:TetR/AcrR family transcriptional regulator [Amycolatopsis anabasis]|uniref:TetR/AcrR family transcriptional regulator n=1 Tax=Amycolatopsis anabasis TaxID=1840409 RepID=UPI00131DD2C4|nr:TetR/AcrR family transcriptional regulator [Amycolatopsis anabasis]
MAARRSDTRERIQRVALELFSENGYEKTSLREIAERLDVTKAALYYHFRTKEDIVLSLIADLEGAVGELVEWGRARDGDPIETRIELLRRFAAITEGQYGPVLSFIQQNMPAMKSLGIKPRLGERMTELFELVCADERDPEAQLRARLALAALLFGANPAFLVGQSTGVDSTIALKVALELASPRPSRDAT